MMSRICLGKNFLKKRYMGRVGESCGGKMGTTVTE